MKKSATSTVLGLAAIVTGIALLAPLNAMAREGGTSVGHGIKCYTIAVPQANGTVLYQRVCRKGV